MNSQPQIERKVGVFVFVGILVTCGLILHFGKVGDHFRSGYPVTVEFNNAGGLVSGAQVLYSGVLVGRVDSIKLKGDGSGVLAELTLFTGGSIRKDARFLIKQSGLLGDQHIVIVPVSSSAPLLASGDLVRGGDPFDFSEAATQAGEAIRKLNQAIDRFSSEVLAGNTVENLKTGVKNFSELTVKLQASSDRFNSLLRDAQKGKGTVGKLLTDDELFDEMKRLIHNWRVHGLLYRDKSDDRSASQRKGATGSRPN